MINTIHSWFTDNSDFYKNWHEKDYHHHVHWAGFVAIALITTFSLTSAIYTTYISTAYAAALPSALVMGTDHIPDFAQDFTKPQVTSLKSGVWSDPTVWSGGVLPTSADIVVIPTGQTITYDSTSGTAYTVSINGTLKFRTDINTKLTVTNLQVMSNGYLEIGTVSTPVNPSVTAEVVIANTAIDTNLDPEQWGTGFLSLGKVRIAGSTKNPTFVKVASEPMAGQSTISLAQAPTGWQIGDRIFIPDTRHYRQADVDSSFYPKVPQWEEFTIQGISGSTITLDRPLTYNHKGARDIAGSITFLPHVGNLTRNVVFRSASSGGTRGHMAMIHMADADIRYATFKDMGRTTFDPLAPGTNQKGRYPLHMHHNMGPMTTPSNGYQFTLIGNAVDGGSSFHKFKWGITVHDSHFGLIQDNVVYNYPGAGIMTEDGNETMNVFDHNFVVRTDGNPNNRGNERGTEFGFEGGGIWLRGPNNILRNNVVANFRMWGIAYWHEYLGNVRIPKYKGADTTVAGQYTVVQGNSIVIPEDSNNEVYGSGKVGFTFWWLGSEYRTPRASGVSVIKDLKIWHVSDNGVWQYPSYNVTFDGLIIRGANIPPNQASCCGLGYQGGDYYGNNITIKNSDIQGMNVGILPSTDTQGTQTIENTYLRNYNSNIRFDTMWTSSCSATFNLPRLTLVNNVKFDASGPATKNIDMVFSVNPVRSVIQKDEVFVTNYNQVAGNNFRVFYKEADASAIVPQGYYSLAYGANCISLLSTPVGGLTNTESFAQYGYAVGGTPATCSDKTSRPEINGITCPYTSISTAPLTPIVKPTGLVGGPIVSTNQTATVSMSVSPTSVSSGGSATITWSSTIATTCTASGGWTGTKATSGTATVNPTANTTYTLTCNGTNINSASQSVAVSVGTGSAPTISMSASPTSVVVGSSSTITWSTTNAVSCTASGDWTGTKGTSGSQSVTPPDAQASYTLTCVGSGGVSASQNIKISLITSPLATVNISASPASINSGSSSTITWSTTNATTCTASGAWSGTKGTSGSVSVSPTANSTYTLTCSGANTTGVSQSTTINVSTPPPATVSISTSPATIVSGNSSTLTWSTTNATTCTASGAWSGTKGTSGSVSVSPTANSTYTLTCSGANATPISKSATIVVTAPPLATVNISASPTNINSGSSSTLTWSTANATTCTASGAWSGTKGTSGSVSVSPTTDSTYTLTCSGANVTAVSKSVTVTVIPPVVPTPTVSISASPTNINSGNSSTLTWSSTVFTTCTASGAWSGTKATSGTVTVSPTANSTYTLTCSGTGLTSISKSVTINVTTISPLATVTISASPSSVTVGSPVSLNWSTTNATTCTASGGWTGVKGTSGSVSISPTANTTYTLACSGANTTLVSQSATVSVTAALISTASISASPSVVVSGDPSTITWSSTNANTCTASGAWSGTKGTSGTVTVNPTSDSVYSISCSGSGGASSVQSASINVTPANTTGGNTGGNTGGTGTGTTGNTGGSTGGTSGSGNTGGTGSTGGTGTTGGSTSGGSTSNSTPSFTISASPTTIKAGESSTISWTSTGYSVCQATAWTDVRSVSGSQVVTPKQTTKYTMACSGENLVTHVDSVTIIVTGSGQANTSVDNIAPVISSVNKTNITKSSVKISWKTSEPATGQIEFVGNCPTTGCVTGLNSELSTVHSMTVVNLNPKTRYVFKIKSVDASGNLKVLSGENILSFTTLSSTGTTTVKPTTTTTNKTTSSSQLVTISASPSSITIGGSSTIKWSSKSYTSCTASGSWAGSKSLSGSQVVSPARTSSYVITCRGANMSPVSKSVTVNIVNSISVQKTTEAIPSTVDSSQTSTGKSSTSVVGKIKKFLDKSFK